MRPQRHSAQTKFLSLATLGALLLGPRFALAASDGLNIIPDWPILGILMLLFVALIFPLNKILFQPLLKAIEEREARIDGARTRAAKLDEEARSIVDNYEATVRTAREEANQERKNLLEGARQERTTQLDQERQQAEQQLEQARSAIDESLEQARSNMRGEAEALAAAAAENILGRSLS